ncbi:MAG: MarR family winged helix-turn-helix transcriptional regulator [Alphaproteobacteria bacterium]|nr:MarR family winged helix-turn-helix transcriptional regulator [Alphaproteobacteria bacterium]
MTPARSLEALHRRLQQAWSNAPAEIGLSYSEFEYLCAVEAQENVENHGSDSHGQHLQDVVAAMGVQKASASAMVIKLEGRKLVKRVPCRFDARAQHILLTPQGRTLLAKGRTIYERAAAAQEATPESDTVRVTKQI